jgi:hypothetical protein
VAERLTKCREASADSDAGVVFRLNANHTGGAKRKRHLQESENHPVCACFGGCAKFSLSRSPPLLAVMQGGEFAPSENLFTPL